ncbi:hypothetical protein ACFLX0_01865 [Chloroflexota bacterium]
MFHLGRQVGIHRITVKRYRGQGEKRTVGTEARIRVIQDALLKHFADLVQVCEKLQNISISGRPEKVLIEDLQTSQELTVVLSGRRGDEVNMVLKVDGGEAEVVHLSIEEELRFASLKQHTKNQDFWPLFSEWKDKSGRYISHLSEFYSLLKQQAVKETGLVIANSDDSLGLTSHFVRTIFNDACDHAFFGYKGFEDVDYAILSPRIYSHELRLDGYQIASAADKETLKMCQEVHQRVMAYYRDPKNYPQEFKEGISIWFELKELESDIFLSLQKLILKRSFLGHCELYPD